MAGTLIGPDGRRWWMTQQAVDRLQVKRARLGDWVRRSKQAGHRPQAPPAGCPACGKPGFPHVDPPELVGRAAAYVVEQLLEAEAYTAGSPRGGASRKDA